MQCAQHPEAVATAYCTNCGVALCDDCIQKSGSRVVCSTCYTVFPLADAAESEPPPPSEAHGAGFEVPPILPPKLEKGYPFCPPAVSFVLGLIPGVGAICNGDYFKAFFQVLIFGCLVSMAGADEIGSVSAFFTILSSAFYFYMPFEAYHVAKKRTLALRGITFISPFERMKFADLWVGVFAVALGIVLLLSQFVPRALSFVMHGWPLLLIGIGVYNLARYFRSGEESRG